MMYYHSLLDRTCSCSSKNLRFAVFGIISVAFMFLLGQVNEVTKCQQLIADCNMTPINGRKNGHSMGLEQFKILNDILIQEPIKI
jgi:hypothetical protein